MFDLKSKFFHNLTIQRLKVYSYQNVLHLAFSFSAHNSEALIFPLISALSDPPSNAHFFVELCSHFPIFKELRAQPILELSPKSNKARLVIEAASNVSHRSLDVLGIVFKHLAHVDLQWKNLDDIRRLLWRCPATHYKYFIGFLLGGEIDSYGGGVVDGYGEVRVLN